VVDVVMSLERRVLRRASLSKVTRGREGCGERSAYEREKGEG